MRQADTLYITQKDHITGVNDKEILLQTTRRNSVSMNDFSGGGLSIEKGDWSRYVLMRGQSPILGGGEVSVEPAQRRGR